MNYKFNRDHYIHDVFKDHVAKLTEAGPVKILDFKKPDSNNYRIRFIFEEDYYRLTITGDLGALSATNYSNMTYENFKDFIRNPGYFIQKIDTCERPIYCYDENLAKNELKERFRKNFIDDEAFNEFTDEVLENFDETTGISQSGYDTLADHDQDAWEYASNIGKYHTGIIEIYLLAYELARKQLT